MHVQYVLTASALYLSMGRGEEEEAELGASDEARNIINPIHLQGTHLSCVVRSVSSDILASVLAGG